MNANKAIDNTHTFENLVIYHAIERAVDLIKMIPCEKGIASPLFIHGMTGAGKTHLVRALVHRMKGRAHYLSGAEFDHLHRHPPIEGFHELAGDVLILDGVQDVTDPFAQARLKGILDRESLHAGCSTVIASDAAPADLKAPTGLQSSLEGTICGLGRPNQPERLTLLRFWNESKGFRLPDELLQLFSRRIRSNVHRLRATFDRADLEQSLEFDRQPGGVYGKKIEWTEGKVMEVLWDYLCHEEVSSFEQIADLVCTRYNLTLKTLMSRRRPANIAWPRQIGMYLARKHTQKSLAEIGKFFGGRDHGTVLHAVRQVERRMTIENSDAAQAIRVLERHLSIC